VTVRTDRLSEFIYIQQGYEIVFTVRVKSDWLFEFLWDFLLDSSPNRVDKIIRNRKEIISPIRFIPLL
jgi:hypothetical protein